jgi:hypothetical protein
MADRVTLRKMRVGKRDDGLGKDMLNRNGEEHWCVLRWAVLLTVLAAPAPLFAQASADLDQVRAAIAAGEYQAALKQIDTQLFPTPKDPTRRYELLMLKGECRLQLKDRTGAMTAFKSAAKAAGNVTELAAARANALIVERSTSGRYVPAVGGKGGEPIDIMDIESRKRAMNQLRDDLSSKYKPRIDSALRADQLPPIEEVFKQVADMYALEMFASGQASDTSAVMQQLGGRADALMHAEVLKCAARLDYLAQVANSSGVNGRGWDTGRMGLTSQQRDEVKAMLPYLNNIRERASEYRGIAARLGGNEGKWDALVADAVAASADAESLYNDR